VKIKIDSYTILARFFPSIISILPLIILYFYLQKYKESINLINFIFTFKIWENVTIAVIIIYFLSQLIRITSKYFEKKIFLSNKGFPTTYFLTYNDSTFSSEFKDAFRRNVKNILNYKMLDENEEKENPDLANKLISESINQIIVLIGERKLVKYHNIWYGFIRNLIGGSVYGIIFSLFTLIIFLKYFNTMIAISGVLLLFLIYFILFLFKNKLITVVAEDYAKKLLAEFMVYSKTV